MAISTSIIPLNEMFFDAKKEYIFKFVYNNGNIVPTHNRLKIMKLSGETVYDRKITTYKFEHRLPPNTLTNGEEYKFVIYIENDDRKEFSSNTYYFGCLDTPVMSVNNIPNDNIIESSEYRFSISYSQAQGVKPDFIQVILQDSNGNEILRSDNIYNMTNFTYGIKYLKEETNYGMVVRAILKNEFITESRVYPFVYKDFKNPPPFNKLIEAKNVCEQGYVRIRNNFISVEAESNYAPPIPVENSEVNLTKDNDYINWNKGYRIAGDFSIRMVVRQMKLNKVFCQLGSGDNRIELSFVENSKYNTYYLQLKCFQGNMEPYYTYSNYIENLTSRMFIYIVRKNDLFEVRVVPY